MIRLPATRRSGAALLAVACVTGMAACSSTSSSSGSSTATAWACAAKSGGSITVALDEDVAGFNIEQLNDNEFVLGEILQQVWPQVYFVEPNLTLKLNTDLVNERHAHL